MLAPLLSVVIPMMNEEQNVIPLVERLTQELKPLDIPYEVILINDGSQDATWEQILAAARNDPRIKGLSLSRNFGHQHALLSGLRFSSGKAIVTMDGDLQHPPELIKDLFAAWTSGYKIVNTKRLASKKTSWLKRLSSLYFYKLFSFLSGIPVQEGSSDFRLIDRQVLENIVGINDVNLFFRGILSWVGFPATCVPYQEGQRLSGKTKYGLKNMFRFAASAIISFSSMPIKLGIWVGIITSVFAFMELTFIIIKYFQGVTVPGWASTVGIISVLFGIQFILLGCIGIYIASIHECLKNRPKFIVNEKFNF
ncbi:MAG TPA: glycosyltransferase family 2 protein [Candidatus Omnitrophota bacterium]|nr:glycosyltransferase family 2 protein [Candidatus Omnitrophota bacterium]HPN56369.1 glycosyltransferase family 2 protein [Candidatus Omnitrophota bacterium]